MSDYEIDRIRIAANSHPMLRYIPRMLARPVIPDPIVVDFCAADFCVVVSL